MMKYLVLILVLLVVVLLAKGARSRLRGGSDSPPAAAPPPAPDGEVMLACAHCGLHLPRSDALPGRGGVFCSEGHRAIAEARHGPS
jgi:uncharacterized protein